LTAKVSDAVCRERGKLMAYWLFWQTMTHGTALAPANAIAEWKSEVLVAPSPQKAIAMDVDFRARIAQAVPTA
jgi:hypothetical protein